jgi:GTP-binding protein
MALKLAIVGRPNVGKSTCSTGWRAASSPSSTDQPGVTRDRRFGPGRLGDLDLELIDTAGFEDVTDESLEAACGPRPNSPSTRPTWRCSSSTPARA